MSEEIKEILEFDFQSQGERIEINEYERDILKDYITNLQEENERLKNQLQQKENIIKEVREYIKNLTNFQIGYGLNENDIKRTMYASENNFVKDILDIVDKGE